METLSYELDENIVLQIGNEIAAYIRKGVENDRFEELFKNLHTISNGNDLMVARIVSTVEGLPLHCGLYKNSIEPENEEKNDPKELQLTMLAKMVINNYINMTKAFLQRYPNMDLEHRFNIDVDGETVLFLAVSKKFQQIVKLLLDYGANVNTQTSTGSTCIRSACCEGNYKSVQLLLEHGANVNIGNNYDNTPLMGAAFYNNYHICETLIDHGADVNAVSKCESNALHYAAKGQVKSLKDLINMFHLLILSAKRPRGLLLDQNHEGESACFLLLDKAFHVESDPGAMLHEIVFDTELTTLHERIDMADFVFAKYALYSENPAIHVEQYLQLAYFQRTMGKQYNLMFSNL